MRVGSWIGLFPSKKMEEAIVQKSYTGQNVLWASYPWTIVNYGDISITLVSEQGGVLEISKDTFHELLLQGKIIQLGREQEVQRGTDTDGYEQTLKRGGQHAADQEKAPYLLLDQHTPCHSDYPFQVVHLERVPLNMHLQGELERLWASFLQDAYSLRIFAADVTLDPPNHYSNMMVLRKCVRRYGRLPQTLVVDGQSDSRNPDFEALLSMYDVLKLERSSDEPMNASPIERLFGMTDTSFIDDVLGNTQSNKDQGEMSETIASRRKAVYTFAEFHGKLCEWCYQVYDQRFQPVLGRTPREAYGVGMASDGGRPHRMILYDEAFLATVLPTTQRGQAKVSPGYGVKIHGRYYWTDEFMHPAVKDTRVPIRYDPLDVSYALALVRGQWHRCH